MVTCGLYGLQLLYATSVSDDRPLSANTFYFNIFILSFPTKKRHTDFLAIKIKTHNIVMQNTIRTQRSNRTDWPNPSQMWVFVNGMGKRSHASHHCHHYILHDLSVLLLLLLLQPPHIQNWPSRNVLWSFVSKILPAQSVKPQR